MNWQGWLLWGFGATVVLTTVMAAAQGMGLTRVSIPFTLGTIFTPDRDRAKAIGFGVHIVNGLAFSFLYVAVFESVGKAGVWRGAAIGLVHSLFVLTAGMRILPGLHPRMADEHHGPDAGKLLEPPGFLGLNYGVQTPLTIIVAHILYGMIIGAFYRIR